MSWHVVKSTLLMHQHRELLGLCLQMQDEYTAGEKSPFRLPNTRKIQCIYKTMSMSAGPERSRPGSAGQHKVIKIWHLPYSRPFQTWQVAQSLQEVNRDLWAPGKSETTCTAQFSRHVWTVAVQVIKKEIGKPKVVPYWVHTLGITCSFSAANKWNNATFTEGKQCTVGIKSPPDGSGSAWWRPRGRVVNLKNEL